MKLTAMETKATVNIEAIILVAEFGGGGISLETGGELGEAGGVGGGSLPETGGELGEVGGGDCWRLVMANFWPAEQWPGMVQMKKKSSSLSRVKEKGDVVFKNIGLFVLQLS